MKRIIACSDGTWNHPHEKEKGVEVTTNVFKIYRYISTEEKDPDGNVIKQVKFYDKGVGATRNKAINIFEGITGEGLDKNIKDAYEFIMQQYEEGDEIYLFGFSRGAYTARSVAGFIRNSGLLKNGNWHMLDDAFELYRDRNETTAPDGAKMQSFKEQYCHQPRIKMVGVWDTVGSLGIPLSFFQRRNMTRYAFHDVKLSSTIDHAYHALAIHERRNTFKPTLWMKNPQHTNVLEQVWFPGVHSNVGGGYANTGLSDAALKWMIGKAQRIGLKFNVVPEVIPDETNGIIYNSAAWYYKLLGIGWRDICLGQQTNEKIHPCVTKRSIAELPLSIRKKYENFLLQEAY